MDPTPTLNPWFATFLWAEEIGVIEIWKKYIIRLQSNTIGPDTSGREGKLPQRAPQLYFTSDGSVAAVWPPFPP
jgi:hypothetical protein